MAEEQTVQSEDQALAEPSERSPAAVDVQRLADRVYRLMLADARLELARLGQRVARPARR